MGTIKTSERVFSLAYAQGPPMLPEARPHLSASLAQQVEHQTGLAPHREASHLTVESVTGIAVVAAAHSDGHAATGHLLGLLAALPAPTPAGERFWAELWRSSGTAYLLPANIKTLVLRALHGEGVPLARQMLSAVDQMTPPQRTAAGEVIGQALVESDDFPDLKEEVIGALWLRDLELTAWRVLHADRRSDDPPGRQAFLDAWTNV